MLSDEWLSRYGLLENFNASVTRTGTGTGTGTGMHTGTGTWTTGVTAIALCTSCSRAKNGVCKGISIFLIFAPKHRLWVLVRVLTCTCTHNLCFEQKKCVPTIYGLSKNKKNINFFTDESYIFYNCKNLCILHGHVFVMICPTYLVVMWYERRDLNTCQFHP